MNIKNHNFTDLDKAKEIFFSSFKNFLGRKEVVNLENSLGRTVAKTVISPENLPSFTRSLTDGYAIISNNTNNASLSNPVSLKILSVINMGQVPEEHLSQGTSMYIPTGGMVPQGADSIVRLEDCKQISENYIEITNSIKSGENISLIGEDIKKADEILLSKTKIKTEDIGILADLGILKIEVKCKPRVVIFSTGDEIIDPCESLKPGQIRDSNSYTISAMVKDAGGDPIRKGIIKDDFNILKNLITVSLEEADMIIVTGGTAVGKRDFIADVFNSIGDPGVLVNGVAQKGGRPVILANVNGKPLIGLPGYPPGAIFWFKTIGIEAIKILN